MQKTMMMKGTIALIFLIFLFTLTGGFLFHFVKFSMYKHIYEEEDETPSRFHRQYQTYNNVPLVIHQIWVGNKKIPPEWLPARNSWLREAASFNKSFKPVYILWNETQIDHFILKTFPWFYKTYTSYRYFIQKIDAARYFILYYYGGIYCDLDIGVKNTGYKSLLDTMKRDVGLTVLKAYPGGVAISLIVSKRKHPLMKRVIYGLKAANTGYVFPYLTVMLSAGTVYFYTKYHLYPKKSQIHVIYPEHAEKLIKNYHGGTWHEIDGKIIWFFYKNRHTLLSFFEIIVVLCIALLVLKKLDIRRYLLDWKTKLLTLRK